MRSRRKEKVNNLIHERISKAWLVKVKVAGKGREGGREREREGEALGVAIYIIECLTVCLVLFFLFFQLLLLVSVETGTMLLLS